MTKFSVAASILLLLVNSTHGDEKRGVPPLFARPLFHGTSGALRLGVVGAKPLHSWSDFPQWRRFVDVWMMREKGYDSRRVTYRVSDPRDQFNITLPDEALDRLSAALGLNVSYAHVEVVLSGDALDYPQSPRPNEVLASGDQDAYLVFVEDSDDVAKTRLSFLRDQSVVKGHIHEAKWAIRKGKASYHCDYDVLNKAKATMAHAGNVLATVNWTQSELSVMAKYELRSLKPVIFIVGVSREEYLRQNASFVAATAAWVHENHLGGIRSPVILTSVELEEELLKRNSSNDKNVHSVLDGLIGEVLRYLQLKRFYVLRENEIQASYIPSGTRASVAAGVAFHERCDILYEEGVCVTREYLFNDTAQSYLAHVDVGKADDLATHNTTTLKEKDFTVKDRNYRIEDGDLVRFAFGEERIEEPKQECAGFEDPRPRLLHPIGSDLRVCLIGLTNSGKTTAFNDFTGAYATVSPRIFTTREVRARSRIVSDERFRWLANQFPGATMRPSTITFVDTPALFSPFGNLPWKDDVLEALRDCDVVSLMIKAFNDSSVERFAERIGSAPSTHVESLRAVSNVMYAHDVKLLARLRQDDTFRKDLDALNMIEDNLRGYLHYFDGDRSGPVIYTDKRVRYHDWSEGELSVLERLRLLTAKPIVYILDMNYDAFEDARTSKTFLDAQKFIKGEDKDALVLPFRARVAENEKGAISNMAMLSDADAIIEKTMADCQIAYFYTANENMVAAWAFKLGTTTEEAVRMTNATLPADATVVEAVRMRDVLETGSTEKALSLGGVHLGFDDEVEDGYLLLLTPGELREVPRETAEFTVSSPDSPSVETPTGNQGHYASWRYAVSLALNLILSVVLLGQLAMLFNGKIRSRIRSFVYAHDPRRDRGLEALLGAMSASTDVSESEL